MTIRDPVCPLCPSLQEAGKKTPRHGPCRGQGEANQEGTFSLSGPKLCFLESALTQVRKNHKCSELSFFHEGHAGQNPPPPRPLTTGPIGPPILPGSGYTTATQCVFNDTSLEWHHPTLQQCFTATSRCSKRKPGCAEPLVWLLCTRCS